MPDLMREALAEQPAQQEPVAHCEAGPEYCQQCYKESVPTYGSEEVRKLREVIESQAKIIALMEKNQGCPPFWPVVQHLLDEYGLQLIDIVASYKQATEQPAQQEWIETACALIKAADDAAHDSDYMLDSNDCIKVLRGEWKGHLMNDQPTAPQPAPVAEPHKQQEPVGEVYRYGEDSHGRHWHGIHWYDANVDVPTGTKLYTSPPPAQQEPVEYWTVADGWVSEQAEVPAAAWIYPEFWDHCKMVGCGTAYRLPGAGRQPLYTSPQPAQQEPQPPYEFERYVAGSLRAQGVMVERATTLADAMRIAARICPPANPPSAPTVLVYTRPQTREPEQPTVPQGWKLVPVEPTPEQIKSGNKVTWPMPCKQVYTAMLNAATQPAQPSKPLTDEQVYKAIKDWCGHAEDDDEPSALDIFRAAEAAHGIKENT